MEVRHATAIAVLSRPTLIDIPENANACCQGFGGNSCGAVGASKMLPVEMLGYRTHPHQGAEAFRRLKSLPRQILEPDQGGRAASGGHSCP